MIKHTLVAVGLVGAVVAGSQVDAGRSMTPPPTIAEIVASSGGNFDHNRNDFDLLSIALETAELTEALNDPDATLTVFAPDDWAFFLLAKDLGYPLYDELGAWLFLVDQLTELGNGDPIPVLTDVLLYHVSPSTLNSRDINNLFRNGGTIPTLLAGAEITPRRSGRLEDLAPRVIDPYMKGPYNVPASNGIIHPISRVLIPADLP